MNLLEGTIVLSIIMGITATTLEMTEEVEKRHSEYQAAQMLNIEKARNNFRKSDH